MEPPPSHPQDRNPLLRAKARENGSSPRAALTAETPRAEKMMTRVMTVEAEMAGAVMDHLLQDQHHLLRLQLVPRTWTDTQ